MVKRETWTPISWYCPNCGAAVTGYQNKKGSIKVQCQVCRTVMVRTLKGEQKNNFFVIPPKNKAEISE